MRVPRIQLNLNRAMWIIASIANLISIIVVSIKYRQYTFLIFTCVMFTLLIFTIAGIEIYYYILWIRELNKYEMYSKIVDQYIKTTVDNTPQNVNFQFVDTQRALKEFNTCMDNIQNESAIESDHKSQLALAQFYALFHCKNKERIEARWRKL